jgi:hypothetical protein
MIQKLYTGHESLEIFEKIYNAITTEDLEHYKKSGTGGLVLFNVFEGD